MRSLDVFVTNMCRDGEDEPDFSVKCVEIRRKRQADEVQAKVLGPLWMVAILGFVESLLLFIFAIVENDQAALLATVSLSLLSSLIGLGNKWTLNLPKRRQPALATPPGNVVIRYANGNFLIVQCTEDVARELYFAPETIKYLLSQSQYRMVSLVGTFMLMVGIISLSNASTPLQWAFAAAYMILNVAYWVVAALPAELHWDVSCFDVMDQCFDSDELSQSKGRSPTMESFVGHNKTFTQGLWKAIIITKSTKWIKKSDAAPKTPAWDEWLREARKQARTTGSYDTVVNDKIVKVWEIPAWNPQEALSKFVQKHMNDADSDSDS
jgi:hypothetical protein